MLAPTRAAARLCPTGILLVFLLALPAPARLPPPADRLDARIFFRDGRELHRRGDLSRAVELYRRALKADPGRLEVLPYLALALHGLNRPVAALECYAAYLAQEPGDVTVRLNQAAALVAAGRPSEAIRELRKLRGIRPRQAALQALWGAALVQEGDVAGGLPRLQKALELNPGLGWARLWLVRVRLARGELEEARELLREPGGPRGWNHRGVLEARCGNRQAAAEALARAGDLPQAVLNRILLGGASRDALLQAAALVDRHPDMASARRLLGVLLYRAGRLDEARLELEAVLAERPGDGLAREYLGLVHLAAGAPGAARRALEQALLDHPEAASVRHNLSLALQRVGETGEALRQAQAAVELDPEVPAAWYNLGWLLDLKGRSAEAAAAFRRYLELAPQAPSGDAVRRRLGELEESPRTGEEMAPRARTAPQRRS